MLEQQQEDVNFAPPPPVKWPLRLFVALCLLAFASVCLLGWAYRYRNDEYLADYIMKMRNSEMKGTMKLGRVHWDAEALVALAVGVPIPATVETFKVYAPAPSGRPRSRGKLVLHVPRATVKVDLLSLIFGGHLLLYRLKVDDVDCTVDTMPGTGKMGFTEAFASVNPSGKRGSRVEISEFEIKNGRLRLGFPSWELELEHLTTRGSFALTGGPTREEGVLFDLKTWARKGKLTIAGTQIPLRAVDAARFSCSRSSPMDLKFKLFTRAAGGLVQAEGRLTNTYREHTGVELTLGAKPAGKLLALFAGPSFGGPVSVNGTIEGPLSGTSIKGAFSGLRFRQGPVQLRDGQGKITLDLEKGKLVAKELRGKGLGGRFKGDGALDLESGDWRASLDVAELNLRPLEASLAGKLTGEAKLRGSIKSLDQGLAVVDLTLQRSRRDWLPRKVAVSGSVHLDRKRIVLAGIKIKGGGATIQPRGWFEPRTLRTDMHVGLSIPRFDRWLARLRTVQAVKGLQTSLHVTGRFPRLRATGRLIARDVGYKKLRLRRLEAGLRFNGQTLTLEKIRSRSMGGQIKGKVSATLFRGHLLRVMRDPLIHGYLQAVGIQLAALGAPPELRGRLNAKAEIKGSVRALTGRATVEFPTLAIQGENYDKTWARVGLLKDRVTIYESRIPRQAGGRLEAWGDVFFDRKVALRLAARDFPLSGIPDIARLPLGIKGILNGQVNVKGTLADPRLHGTVQLTKAEIRNRKMGSGSVTLKSGSDYVHVSGDLLGRLVKIDGHLLTAPHARMHLRVDVDKFPIEKVFYEVRKLGDVRGRVSGTVRMDLDAVKGLTWARAKFPALELTLRHRLPGEADHKEVRLANTDALLASWDGKKLEVVTAKMETSVAGQRARATFTVGGWVSPKSVNIKLRGDVALDILEFFLKGRVKRIIGTAVANVNVTGPLNNVDLKGLLDLKKISVQMPRFHQLIEIPRGQVRLTPGSLNISRLVMKVGPDELKASGKVELEQFSPKKLALQLTGVLNLKLLELVFPRYVSSAAGTSWVRLKVGGPVTDPMFSGDVGIKTVSMGGRKVEIIPRGWGRTMTLRKGQVAFSNYLIETKQPLEGTYDEGIVRLWGEVRHDHFDIVDMNLRVLGNGIPQRQPKVYSAEINVDATLSGDSEQLHLNGAVELVDVRYVRKFDIISRALIKPRIAEEETPFWKGSRVLENLRMDLAVRSLGQILVKNNLANLSMSGDFTVTGTLSDPRLDGLIRVDEGTFKLPMTRGEFTINLGEIVFARQKPLDQGEINISSESNIEGRDDVDYQVKMRVVGPLNKPGIKLTSTPSLDQGQIWSLLAFGATTDQLRTQLQGKGDSSSSQGAGAAADAQVKQLTGEILSQIIEDPLKKVTRLDVISLEVGTESAQIRARKKLGRFVSLAGEYELGLLGESRAEGRLEIKMHDLLMLIGKWERLSTRLETEEEDPSRGRLELKLRLPLRW